VTGLEAKIGDLVRIRDSLRRLVGTCTRPRQGRVAADGDDLHRHRPDGSRHRAAAVTQVRRLHVPGCPGTELLLRPLADLPS
jgi:hypothetical protein